MVEAIGSSVLVSFFCMIGFFLAYWLCRMWVEFIMELFNEKHRNRWPLFVFALLITLFGLVGFSAGVSILVDEFNILNGSGHMVLSAAFAMLYVATLLTGLTAGRTIKFVKT